MVTTVTVSGLSTTITGLTAGTTYYYTITALNNTTPGPVSAVQNHTTDAPANLTIVRIGGKILMIDGSVAKY